MTNPIPNPPTPLHLPTADDKHCRPLDIYPSGKTDASSVFTPHALQFNRSATPFRPYSITRECKVFLDSSVTRHNVSLNAEEIDALRALEYAGYTPASSCLMISPIDIGGVLPVVDGIVGITLDSGEWMSVIKKENPASYNAAMRAHVTFGDSKAIPRLLAAGYLPIDAPLSDLGICIRTRADIDGVFLIEEEGVAGIKLGSGDRYIVTRAEQPKEYSLAVAALEDMKSPERGST